ncbi:MAG: inositol monophosphatase family protein [Acidiferrobacterales bacterium]
MLPELEKLGLILHEAAAAEIMPRFAEVARTHKADGSIVTAADLSMQRRVAEALNDAWPEFGFLGEEMTEEQQRQAWDADSAGLWCMDPLDGTSNFASGIPFFSVALALFIDQKPVLGMVYDPVREECFAAQKDEGAWLNGNRLTSDVPGLPLKRSIGVVDFKRLSPQLGRELGQNPPYGSQRNFGSSALEWCWLAADRFHVYVHGGQKLWDYAAGSLILSEAGGHAQTLDGEAVPIGKFGSRSVVAALDEELFKEWQAWLERVPK